MNMNRLLFSGALWSWVTKFGNQGISFLVFLIVARLIGPEQYGLASLCFVIFALGSIMLNGLGDGIIALQEKSDTALSSLLWFILGVALLMSALCLVLAEPLAQWLALPDLAGLLLWFAPVFLLFGVGVVPNKLIYANMDFRLFAIRGLIGSLCSAVVGVFMAYQGLGAYAMVGQQLALYLVMSLIAWLVIDWRPKWTWSARAVRRLLPPGFKAMSTESLEFADQQFPRFLIGTYLGPTGLGYFSFASRIKFAIQDIIINPPLIVVYPAIAKMKGEPSRQALMASQFLLAIGSVVFPFVTLAVLLAPLYVPCLFGDKWIGATTLLQLFIVMCALTPFSVMVRELFRANNRLGVFINSQIAVLPISLLLYFVLLPYGLTVLALGLLSLMAIVVPVQFFILKRYLGIELFGSLINVSKPLILSLVMGVIVFYTETTLVDDYSSLLRLGFLTGLGVLSYAVMYFICFRKDVAALVQLIRLRNA